MSTLRLTTISNQTGSSSVPSETVINGSAKAWVNFNGTGTVAIRASFNVSSITDGGVGLYTVNFTTAISDINYAPIIAASANYGVRPSACMPIFSNTSWAEVVPTTTAFQFAIADDQGGTFDAKYVAVSVFR